MELSDAAKQSLNKLVDSTADSLANAISSTGELVKNNATELVHEVIVYEGYIDNAFSLLGSLILAAFVTLGWNHVDLKWEMYGLCYAVLGVLYFTAVCWFLCGIQGLMKAKFAPRLFLVQFATSLLKKDSNSDKK